MCYFWSMVMTVTRAAISAGTLTAVVGVVGAIVALATLIKALIEYTQQGVRSGRSISLICVVA